MFWCLRGVSLIGLLAWFFLFFNHIFFSWSRGSSVPWIQTLTFPFTHFTNFARPFIFHWVPRLDIRMADKRRIFSIRRIFAIRILGFLLGACAAAASDILETWWWYNLRTLMMMIYNPLTLDDPTKLKALEHYNPRTLVSTWNSEWNCDAGQGGHDKWYTCHLIFVQNDSVYNDIRA